MKAVRRSGTTAERAVRAELHARGRRFYVDRAVVPGVRSRPDIVFPRARVAVFIDGCFWHMCPRHASLPRSNRDWWVNKLEANVSRDRDADLKLSAVGWTVVRAWEHESPSVVADEVERALSSVGGDQ
jgi:DNA mismatch endonuclease (patch repair protein)